MLMENVNPTALYFLICLATSGSWCIFYSLLTTPSSVLSDPLNEAVDRLRGENIVLLLP